MEWLLQNWGNILVVSLVLLLLGAVIVARVRAKRRGESGCSCGCGGCAMRDICHDKNKKN